jgi:hypothetical protein
MAGTSCRMLQSVKKKHTKEVVHPPTIILQGVSVENSVVKVKLKVLSDVSSSYHRMDGSRQELTGQSFQVSPGYFKVRYKTDKTCDSWGPHVYIVLIRNSKLDDVTYRKIGLYPMKISPLRDSRCRELVSNTWGPHITLNESDWNRF